MTFLRNQSIIHFRRPTDNAFRVDGIIVNDHTNAGPGSSLRVNMGVDAIREFSVLTNNYSAEYGRGSGGIVRRGRNYAPTLERDGSEDI